jgi:hypothetical protein
VTLPRRWLQRCLDEATAPSMSSSLSPSSLSPSSLSPSSLSPSSPSDASSSSPPSSRSLTSTQARRLCLSQLSARGLAMGTPLLRADQQLSRDVADLEPIVRLLAVVADVVGAAAAAMGLSSLTRSSLAAAVAVVYGDDDGEDARLLALRGLTTTNREERALSSLEREVARRRYLVGNPLLGLTLHRALVATDARALALCALDVAAGAVADAAFVQRVQKRLARERLAVTASIAGLSEWREPIDVDVVRQASTWQVEHLGLGRDQTVRLLEVVKRPPDLSRLLTLVPADARGRVFLQTALAAVVDGRVSADELRHLSALGELLGLPARSQARTRRRVADFVRRHADAFNPLADAAGFAAVDPPLAVRVARVVFENADALWTEIRETGDLGVLLARRASGQRLSDDEHRRMREQLIDVVKAVPALAMFALPGGFVLLPLLLKVLPFDLRTSAFQSHDDFHTFARDQRDSLTPRDRSEREDRLLSSSTTTRWRS